MCAHARVATAADRQSGRDATCRERPSACVAPSVSPSPPNRCWSTCATVKTASCGQARHGAAPRTFRTMRSGWMVRTRFIPGPATRGPVSTTISAQPAGRLFAGPARRAPRDLASRLGPLTMPHSLLQRCLFGKKDDTRGRLPSTMWLIGTRNLRRRLLAESAMAACRQRRYPRPASLIPFPQLPGRDVGALAQRLEFFPDHGRVDLGAVQGLR